MSEDGGSIAVSRKILISASVSLGVMVMEYIWLIRDERKTIWPKVRSSRYAKLYMTARYPGLIGQIFNVYFVSRMNAGIAAAPSTCRIWYSYQAILVQLLLAAVEIPLMHRVYALYFRNRAVLLVLILIGGAQVASMVLSARMSVPGVRYSPTCLVIKTHPGSVYFSATTMTTNIVVFFMTFWKYLSLPRQWTQNGFGRVVLRDSALSLLAISILMLFMILCTLNVIKTSMNGNITYYWLVCVLWVALGRIIVNHEKVSVEDETRITSEIEMGEMSGENAVTMTLHSTKTTGTLTGEPRLQQADRTREESPTPTAVDGNQGVVEVPAQAVDQKSDANSVSTGDHSVHESSASEK